MDETKEEVWYKEGLRFGCRQCGSCCTGEEGYVWVTEEEITKLAQTMKVPRAYFEATMVYMVKDGKKSLRERPNGDCVLLTPGKGTGKGTCMVYADRPVQCRTWPFWPQNLDSEHSWKETAKFCRGCNNRQGRLYTVEEIEEQAGQLFGL
ncbi:MAG: YkgJ family cysteine cluster protein [Planctomycetia bacterium]|nr:YkgJ family cysteine cluster protein [Planctomycetia bacterium]